ncbi:FAD binding domain/Oxidoreductase NAD-binding domain containing protein, putative [Angomonas deanei]|uniref:NADPH--hemoprotein reductase n=1 Tax=Angomonas deanei TaxID=59799 RepID=A0A7G2C2X2_9TRYP|nr:FAD binding domain/Oxidoreductase NAD-binding domain containing protein, putative [Angomonas deanei]
MTSPPLAGDDSEQKTEHSSILTRYQAENALTGPAGGTNDAVICQWRNMTVSGNRVIQLTLSVSEETVWQPGQTIALLPWNETSVVDRFLKHFNENGEAPFHPLSVVGEASSCFVNSPIYSYIDFPLSLRKVLTRYVSLRIKNSNGKEIIGLLKQHTESADDHAALNAILQELTSTPTELITILEKFPHIKPPIRHLIENLFTLQPREYSICSAKSKDPHHLSICFKVVPFGLCTHWLFEQCLWSSNLPVPKEDAARSGEWQKVVRRCVIPFVLRPPTEFRMPKDPLIPLILIGPGLGVNPFIAFLEEREQQVKERGGLVTSAQESPLSEGNPTTGTIDLFFGCRRRYEDFLFKEELSSFFQTKVLNSLTVAFSREANDGAFWYGGCYVQEKLLESALVISELITQKSAYVYVCGDSNMGKEVHQTLIEIIQQTTGKSESGATEYVEYIMSQGRYTRDVW